MGHRLLLAAGLVAGLAVNPSASASPAEARAVLEAKCLSCHGTAAMSGLDLRSRDALLKGGARGPSVIPGDPSASPLYQAVLREGDLKMPPGKSGLEPREIEALRAWIEQGAPWEGAAPAAAPTWWAFRPLERHPVPEVSRAARSGSPIDRFLLAAMSSTGLEPLPRASAATLVRRAYFDLHGLPPPPESVDRFAGDPSPEAWSRLIDELLASPRYAERWGRHWLDVVRYADTGGFETDHYFANAWRYRDYVIESFHRDKPYDVFVQEQIAADEIWGGDFELEGSYDLPKHKQELLHRRLGTGLYTLGAFPVEITFWGDLQRAEWQAESVDVTGAAFLGLTLGCARCHDHKFDPVPQRDYYRLGAIFAGSEDREIPIVSQMAIYEYTRHQTRQVIADQLKVHLKQLQARVSARGGGYTAAERDERETLLCKLGEAFYRAPDPYDRANVLVHSDKVPDTHVLIRGEYTQKGEKVRPGFLSALGPAAEIEEPEGVAFVPARRKALAEWITGPAAPLLARVMVNRIWQGHFGRGIVSTANDFGRQGDPPSHPELLEWLAAEFIDRGWSLKAMHRLILQSAAYQVSSGAHQANAAIDPDNRYFWRMNRRRLEAEAVRDAVLATAGTLNLKAGGPPVAVPLTEEEMDGMRDPSQWPVAPDPAEHTRRSVFLFVKRSFRLPVMEVFDAPDSSASCARRETSTVAPQALAMMNSEFVESQARALADRLRREHGDNRQAWVETGWRLAFGRAPSVPERTKALAYLTANPLDRLCLVWFNMSEFLYVD